MIKTSDRIVGQVWRSPTLMTWGSLLIRFSSVVMVLPMVLHRFKPPEAAVWMLFSSIFTLILLLDLGLAPTFSRLFSYALGGVDIDRMAVIGDDRWRTHQYHTVQDPRPAILRVFHTLLWIYPRLAAISVGLFLVVGAAMLKAPISQCAEPASVWLAALLVLAGAYAGIVGNAFTVALQGMGEIALQKRCDIFLGAAQVVSCFVMLFSGGGIFELVVAYQSWIIIGAIGNFILLRRRFKYLKGARPRLDKDVLKVLWPPAWRSGVGVLMSHGLIQFSGLVYSQLTSTRELASYLLTLRVITFVSQLSQAPFYSKLPEMARLHATGQSERCLTIARDGMMFAQGFLALSVVAIAFCSGILLSLIDSQIQFVSFPLWCLMAVAFFVERFGAMHLQLYSVTNHITWHIANGVTGILMISVAFALYPHLGVFALPLAMLIAYSLFYAPYATLLSRRAFGFSLWRFEVRASIPAFLGMVVGFILVALLSGLQAT